MFCHRAPKCKAESYSAILLGIARSLTKNQHVVYHLLPMWIVSSSSLKENFCPSMKMEFCIQSGYSPRTGSCEAKLLSLFRYIHGSLLKVINIKHNCLRQWKYLVYCIEMTLLGALIGFIFSVMLLHYLNLFFLKCVDVC